MSLIRIGLATFLSAPTISSSCICHPSVEMVLLGRNNGGFQIILCNSITCHLNMLCGGVISMASGKSMVFQIGRLLMFLTRYMTEASPVRPTGAFTHSSVGLSLMLQKLKCVASSLIVII